MSVCTACGTFYDFVKIGGLHCSLEEAPIRPTDDDTPPEVPDASNP